MFFFKSAGTLPSRLAVSAEILEAGKRDLAVMRELMLHLYNSGIKYEFIGVGNSTNHPGELDIWLEYNSGAEVVVENYLGTLTRSGWLKRGEPVLALTYLKTTRSPRYAVCIVD